MNMCGHETLKKKNKRIQVWWHTVGIPALVGLKHGDWHEFETSLNNSETLSPK